MDPLSLPRRDLLTLSAAGALAGASLPWVNALADSAAVRRTRGKSCIILWTDGGMSQNHTFDPLPAPLGEFRATPTSVPGIHICEQFPRIAQCMEDIILFRTMKTPVGSNHFEAKYTMHTGFMGVAGVQHPSIGSIASAELTPAGSSMPGFVTIDAGYDIRTDGGAVYRPSGGYLGPQYDPVWVMDPLKGLDNLRPLRDAETRRVELLESGERAFAEQYPTVQVAAHRSVTERAIRMMQSSGSRAFSLDLEPEPIRTLYGPHRFAQSCLLARRLVESGVSLVEVIHRGWDDHQDAATNMAVRAPWFDQSVAALITDLKQRGMLDDTLVVLMGEFGRDVGNGLNHHADGWSTLWAGGGLKTGQVVGVTEKGKIKDRPIRLGDYMMTLCTALGIETHQEFIAPGNRPVPVIDMSSKPKPELIQEVFG